MTQIEIDKLKNENERLRNEYNEVVQKKNELQSQVYENDRKIKQLTYIIENLSEALKKAK